MKQPPDRLRVLVLVTITFLLLDAVLLLVAAVLLRRLLLVAVALLLAAMAGAVIGLRRRFSRRWDEVTAARRHLGQEVASWRPGSREDS